MTFGADYSGRVPDAAFGARLKQAAFFFDIGLGIALVKAYARYYKAKRECRDFCIDQGFPEGTGAEVFLAEEAYSLSRLTRAAQSQVVALLESGRMIANGLERAVRSDIESGMWTVKEVHSDEDWLKGRLTLHKVSYADIRVRPLHQVDYARACYATASLDCLLAAAANLIDDKDLSDKLALPLRRAIEEQSVMFISQSQLGDSVALKAGRDVDYAETFTENTFAPRVLFPLHIEPARPVPVHVTNQVSIAKSSDANAGGRPTKHDWDGLHIALGAIISAQFPLPLERGDQAQLEDFAKHWFTKQGAGEPAPAQVREHVKKVIQAHMEAKDLA